MAIKKKAKIGIIDFIHPDDDAINIEIDEDTGEPISNIDEYKKSWDFEKHCVLKEGKTPTIFKINFNIPFGKNILIKNAQIGNFKGEEGGSFTVGSHAAQLVRTILVGIENPADQPKEEGIVFKKTGANLVADSTMEELEACGIVDDLYGFYLSNKEDTSKLKKN